MFRLVTLSLRFSLLPVVVGMSSIRTDRSRRPTLLRHRLPPPSPPPPLPDSIAQPPTLASFRRFPPLASLAPEELVMCEAGGRARRRDAAEERSWVLEKGEKGCQKQPAHQPARQATRTMAAVWPENDVTAIKMIISSGIILK